MLITVVLFSSWALIASVAFQMAQRRARTERFRGLTLVPNCLLTRYPIAFLSGPRTVFRLFDHWNDVPLYLREHGYEVYVIEPTGRSTEERCASVQTALESFGSRCHLVADASLEHDLERLSRLRPLQASTFTLVKTPHRDRYFGRPSISARDLKPSNLNIFEVHGTGSSRFASRVKLVLLMAHNFLVRRRTEFVHPFETAEVSSGFASERPFLELAISLAERDLIESD